MTKKTENRFLVQAILSIRPNAEFLIADSYESLIWISKDQEKPNKEEVQAKLTELRNAEPMQLLREERNRRLVETDWWCCSDQTPTQAQLNYRTALRDLPSTASPTLDEQGNLTNVTWPTKPT